MRTRDMRRPGRTLAAASTAVALAIGLAACGSDDEGGSTNNAGGGGGDAVKVGLITKTETNPFFVKMKEGADAAGQGGRARSCSPSRARRTATTSAGRGRREPDLGRREGPHDHAERLQGDRARRWIRRVRRACW